MYFLFVLIPNTGIFSVQLCHPDQSAPQKTSYSKVLTYFLIIPEPTHGKV